MSLHKFAQTRSIQVGKPVIEILELSMPLEHKERYKLWSQLHVG